MELSSIGIRVLKKQMRLILLLFVWTVRPMDLAMLLLN